MNVEQTVKDIKKLYSAISGLTDHDVGIIYRGNSYGVEFPWRAYIDKRECNAKSHAAALETLLDMLKAELLKKAEDAKTQAASLEKTLKEVRS